MARIARRPRFSAVVIGPGFGVGEATREIVETLLATAEKGRERPLGLVLDADALMSFAPDWEGLAKLVRSSGADGGFDAA